MQLSRLLYIFLAIHISVIYSTTKILFPGLTKITNELYVGKFDDTSYLSMQRIESEDIDDWIWYIQNQINSTMRVNLQYLSSLDGARAFKLVLDNYKSGVIKENSELWIACITNKPVSSTDLFPSRYKNSIIMYVTVITTPNALLTSHMGISRTFEEAVALENNTHKRQLGQSLHLHSFAAKVMLERYPDKIYMLTVPTNIMRDILLSNLPKNIISVGDNKYQMILKSIKEDKLRILDKLTLEKKINENEQEWKKRINDDADRLYAYDQISNRLELLKDYPPRISITTQNGIDNYTILTAGKQPIVFNKNNPHYQWLFTEAYRPKGLRLPYVLIDLKGLAQVKDLHMHD